MAETERGWPLPAFCERPMSRACGAGGRGPGAWGLWSAEQLRKKGAGGVEERQCQGEYRHDEGDDGVT